MNCPTTPATSCGRAENATRRLPLRCPKTTAALHPALRPADVTGVLAVGCAHRFGFRERAGPPVANRFLPTQRLAVGRRAVSSLRCGSTRSRKMRRIGWLVLLLAAFGWLAAESPPPADQRPPADLSWRRTRDGWQRATWLADPIPVHRPALHPAVVGTLELLLSMTALVAFAEAPPRNSRPRTFPKRTTGPR